MIERRRATESTEAFLDRTWGRPRFQLTEWRSMNSFDFHDLRIGFFELDEELRDVWLIAQAEHSENFSAMSEVELAAELISSEGFDESEQEAFEREQLEAALQSLSVKQRRLVDRCRRLPAEDWLALKLDHDKIENPETAQVIEIVNNEAIESLNRRRVIAEAKLLIAQREACVA